MRLAREADVITESPKGRNALLGCVLFVVASVAAVSLG